MALTQSVVNVHNLCNVIKDVKNFGPLFSISSYPFENFLGSLKGLLRSGNKPLAQLVKRICELQKFCMYQKSINFTLYLNNEVLNIKHQIPECKKIYNCLILSPDLMLSQELKNK